MICSFQSTDLQYYAQALQRQNEAIRAQQTVLYRQLQNMNQQINKMQEYYRMNKQLTEQIQVLEIKHSQQLQRIYKDRLQLQTAVQFKIIQIQQEMRCKDETIFKLQQEVARLGDRQKTTNQQIAQLRMSLTQQADQNRNLIKHMQFTNQHIGQLNQKIKDFQQTKQKAEQSDLDNLIQSYQEIQTALRQKQQEASQMRNKIKTLSHTCQMQLQQITQTQLHAKKLQAQIQKFLQNSSPNQQFEDEQQESQLLRVFSKIDLIKNSNKMIERICLLEKDNNSHIVNRSQIDVCTYNKIALKSASASSQNQLQLKLQKLKVQNQRLIKNLII